MSQTPPSLLNATIEQLQKHAPFDQMEMSHLDFLVNHLQLGYYQKDAVIITPTQREPERFYIIKQGVVVGEQGAEGVKESSAHWQLIAGECFPVGALLGKRPVASIYRAEQDTFCYELQAEHFDTLLEMSPAFRDFCTRRISNLLEQSQHLIQAEYSRSSSQQQSLNSTLGNLLRGNVITCRPDTPLRHALQTMQDKRVGSMVITNEAHHPLGIFTLHDLLDKVTLAEHDINLPISTVMSTHLITLPSHAFVHDAAVAMARHSIRHLLIVDECRLTGIISEKDLFTLQRVGLTQISSTIRHAASVETLQQSSHDIRLLANNMLAQGVTAEHLTQIISTLNDALTVRVIELVLSAAGLKDLPFCWIALGSEGRLEQTLSTDQDNGIIFPDSPGQSPDAMRQQLLPIAAQINKQLDMCGFPLCKGNIMAGNPQLCMSLTEWKNTFADWIHRGDALVLLNASIFFDFRSIYGVESLAQQLRQWLNASIKDNRLFLRRMAENALTNRPPLGLVRDFSVSDKEGAPHSIDLKINGVTPFVDAARIFCLQAGISETNTLRRLRASAGQWKLDKAQVDAWCEAFSFIQLLRLRLHHAQNLHGTPLGNRIDPNTLNGLDRRILKEAFRQARKLQALLERIYQF